MGDEDNLRHELLDAARGVPPRTSVWKKGQGVDAYFSGQGSQNIWLMRFAVQALMGQSVPWGAVYAYQFGPSSVIPDAPNAPMVIRDGQLVIAVEPLGPSPGEKVVIPGFGGSEFMSCIYWTWHVMSHTALIRSKNPDLSALARRWVVLNWVLFRAITAPDGSLMLFGQRSAGHVPFPREMDWIYALASGGDLKRAEKWCKIMGAGLRFSWEREIALELQPELQATWRESLTVPIETLFLPLRVPTEIVRTSAGIAVVHASNCNPNTPPILAGTCDLSGRRVVCPTSVGRKGELIPGGVRIRQKFDHASARIDGEEIVYQSSLYTKGQEIRIAMPRGYVLYHLRLGAGEAAAPPSEPTPGTGTTEPVEPPPAPASDLSRAADLLSSLKLAKKHQGEREAVVAAIRKGESPAPYLEIIRRWFRPDSPQSQAAQWREALTILQEHAQ